jgi:hypothetical protein
MLETTGEADVDNLQSRRKAPVKYGYLGETSPKSHCKQAEIHCKQAESTANRPNPLQTGRTSGQSVAVMAR